MVSLIAMCLVLITATYVSGVAPRVGSSRRSKTADPFRGRFSSPPNRAHYSNTPGGHTIRCHHCATYFPDSKVVIDVVQGHVLEFCTPDCKRNFLKQQRP